MTHRPDEAFDLLIWIGSKFNPTMENFIDEAKRLGCCRRVVRFPYGIKVGVSRVFLIHDNGQKGQGHIFAYFTINAVEYVVGPGHNLPQELAERGVKPVSIETIISEPERGCGKRQVGAIYLVSSEDMEKLRDLADETDLHGKITLVTPVIPYPWKRFRGFKYCWGDVILARQTRYDWGDLELQKQSPPINLDWFQGIHDFRKEEKKKRRKERRQRQH